MVVGEADFRERVMADNPSEALKRIEKALKERSTSLDLSGLGLTDLPKSLGQLAQLRNLDLSNNDLTELPEWLGSLLQLESLDVSINELTELRPSLRHLMQLETLILFHNKIRELPEWVGQLTRLRYLSLFGNTLRDLPRSLRQLTRLQILNLSNNELTELPESLSQLRELLVLDLSSNELTELPKSMGQLKQLKFLYLDHNELTELPELSDQLAQLDLSHNKLTFVPASISQLIRLEILNLSSNELKVLSKSLREIPNLDALFLHGNEELGLPPEVLGPTFEDIRKINTQPARPREILEYYFRLGSGRRPLNEAKLILVGRGAVGKTSLVNQLVHGYFNKDEKKTEGIKITEWKFKLNKEDIRLNIWDFGGQEIMHATHQFFLTQRSLYLLVLNGREGGEDADAEYWLRLIESFGGESPVIVVLNKIREHPFDLNRRALQQKYPIREFIETDCEDGTGIDRLREIFQTETNRLEDLRKSFPAGWFTIKDRLAAMEDNYLSFDDYRRVCEQNGEADHKAQEDLAGFLHRLGIALNYRDDARLQDTHVLNPRWVTEGIYKLLNSEKLQKKKGEIRLADLASILDPNQYPAGMRRFILDLMKKFELCFSFPEDDARYLIPELLDKQQPPEADQFKPEECLNFQYHYSVLPEGLLPRFIVRTHVLSEGVPRWRTGVIMEFEGCRALVKADVQDKKVFISVLGPTASRRRLLAVIRSDFERIHRDIRNLEPAEMVPVPEQPNLVVPYKKLQVMERGGVGQFKEVADDEIVELNTAELLNGVDLEHTRKADRVSDERRQATRLFYSYSHKDEFLRNELDTHLKLLQRQRLIETWHDRRINPGDEFDKEIDENLERADIILLLVSSDFIASDYCYDIEMKRALERHQKGEARVIPIILRDVNWKIAPFAQLQALPKDGLPVTKWPDKDSAWRNVSEGIERVVEEMRKNVGRFA